MYYNHYSHASTFISGLKCYMQFIQSEYYPTQKKLSGLLDETEKIIVIRRS